MATPQTKPGTRTVHCGLALKISITAMRSDPQATAALAMVMRQVLGQGAGVSLTIGGLPQADAVSALERFCAELAQHGVRPAAAITCVLGESSMPLRSFVLVSRHFLGDGPRYAVCDERTDWRYLWRHRKGRWAVWPAYANFVSSECGLLDDERADAIVPPAGIQAPAGSAWLPVEVDLVDYSDAAGSICLQRLAMRLQRAVNAAEVEFANACWPIGVMRTDAARNRRLAVHLTGMGDLLCRRQRCPADPATQQALYELLAFARSVLVQAAQRAAARTPLLPAIERTNPSRGSLGGVCSQDWLGQWRSAARRNRTAHRNLLVMSPYSALPRYSPPSPHAADILPMLKFSDACSFANPPFFEGWNFKQFKDFHVRARAEIRHREAPSIIAARV